MEENIEKQINQIFEEAEKTLINKASSLKTELRRLAEKIVKENKDFT